MLRETENFYYPWPSYLLYNIYSFYKRSNYLVHKNLTIKKLSMYERDYGLLFFIKTYFIITSNMRQRWLCKPQFIGSLNCYVSKKTNKQKTAAGKAVGLEQWVTCSQRGGQAQTWYEIIYVLEDHCFLPRLPKA